jgi:hypothetical protein
MSKQFITEAKRMQKLAGIIAENQEETIDEGFKDWLIGLGLTAATILGGVKVHQLDQKQQADRKAQIAFYEKNIRPVLNKMSDEKKLDLGSSINDRTKKFAFGSSDMTGAEAADVLKRYAEDYIKNHSNEFSIGEDSLIYWNKAKENPYK